MSLERRSSVSRKIALSVFVPIAALALGLLFVAWRIADRNASEATARSASTLADLVAASFSLAPTAPSESAAKAHQAVSSAFTLDWRWLDSVRELRVLDPKGEIRWSRRPEEVGTPLVQWPRVLAAPAGGVFDRRTGELIQPLGGVSCAPCHPGDALRVGAVQVMMDQPKVLGGVSRAFLSGALLIVGVAILLAGMTVFAAGVFVVRPLRRLSGAMLRAKEGDIMTRAPVETHDEVGLLAETFNTMLARLTDMKAQEIDRSREVESLHRELELKEQLNRQHQIIEETNRELAEKVRELSLLFDVTQSLNSTLELEEILKRITLMVGDTLGFREFSTMLYDEVTKDLEIKAVYGEMKEAEVVGRRLKVGEGAAGLAAEKKEIVYIEDTRSDPRYVRLGDGTDREGSLLCIPLQYKQRLVGVLNFSRPNVAGFSPDEIRLLLSVANQASMAIVNARLFQETVELSLTDPLTAVANRRHLFQQLEMEVRRAQRFGTPMSFVMIDIDHFKLFNDASGHPAGDALLREVASLLSQSLRKVDVLARYGGEEFAVILPKVRKSEALEVAEKLLKAVLRTDFKYGERQPTGRVTISVGVSSLPEDAQTMEKVVDAADSALYASKRGGRNLSTAFQPGMEFHPGRERGPYAKKKKKKEESSVDQKKLPIPDGTPGSGTA